MVFKRDLKKGPVRESNPGPLAPKARIMPLDQQAILYISKGDFLANHYYCQHSISTCSLKSICFAFAQTIPGFSFDF